MLKSAYEGSVGILKGSVGILINWYYEHWYFERWYFEPLSVQTCLAIFQGAWRDANTGQVLDLSRFWAPGQVFGIFQLQIIILILSPQPNGVRVQNCAGIFENVLKTQYMLD